MSIKIRTKQALIMYSVYLQFSEFMYISKGQNMLYFFGKWLSLFVTGPNKPNFPFVFYFQPPISVC